ncbi:MAG: GxxExxY protein [Chthoniobacteraceae bacterium]
MLKDSKMEVEGLLFKEESYALMGACFEVYKDKGCGFLESVYHECLAIEMDYREIPFISQPQLSLSYRDKTLAQHFVPDFLCYGKIIIELKAVSTLTNEHRAQTINYLKATRYPLGLLVNFGHYPKVEHERILNLKNDHQTPAPHEIVL